MSTTHLSIEVVGGRIQFSSFKNQTLLNQYKIKVDENNYSLLSEEIDQHISSNHFITKEHDEVTLSVATNKSSVVPTNVFGESSAKEIYHLCFGDTEKEIDYNRISELGIVNVFNYSSWIKRYFVMKFPRVIFQNEATNVLRQVMSDNSFFVKLTVIVHKEFFQLTISKHNELVYYSFFDCQNYEDIIYHMLFTLQQKELADEKGTIVISKAFDADKELTDQLIKDIAKVKDFSKLNVQQVEDYISKSHFLCV